MTIKVNKYSYGKLAMAVSLGEHGFLSDVPASSGGDDLGPDPHDLFDAALASCTALTVLMYAQRKGWALTDIEVEIDRDNRDEKMGVYRLQRRIALFGTLSDEERSKLIEIADKCPIHQLMHAKIDITTTPVAVI